MQDGFLKERQEKPELKFIQGHRLEKGCLLTMETVLSLERQQLLEIMLPYIRVLRLEVPEKKPENVIPTLRDNVMVSAGAKVIGSFTIGENSKIGAGSVVLEEVPPNCTVVGVPGRIVKRENRKVPRSDMDQIHLPDPVLEDIRTLQKENEALKSKLQRMEYQLQEIREEKEKNEL